METRSLLFGGTTVYLSPLWPKRGGRAAAGLEQPKSHVGMHVFVIIGALIFGALLIMSMLDSAGSPIFGVTSRSTTLCFHSTGIRAPDLIRFTWCCCFKPIVDAILNALAWCIVLPLVYCVVALREICRLCSELWSGDVSGICRLCWTCAEKVGLVADLQVRSSQN